MVLPSPLLAAPTRRIPRRPSGVPNKEIAGHINKLARDWCPGFQRPAEPGHAARIHSVRTSPVTRGTDRLPPAGPAVSLVWSKVSEWPTRWSSKRAGFNRARAERVGALVALAGPRHSTARDIAAPDRTGPRAARCRFAPSCSNKAASRSGRSSWTGFATSTPDRESHRGRPAFASVYTLPTSLQPPPRSGRGTEAAGCLPAKRRRAISLPRAVFARREG